MAKKKPPKIYNPVNPSTLSCSRIYLLGTRGRCGVCGCPVPDHRQSNNPPQYKKRKPTSGERWVQSGLSAVRQLARSLDMDPRDLVVSRRGFGGTTDTMLKAGPLLRGALRIGDVNDGGHFHFGDEETARMRYAALTTPFAKSLTTAQPAETKEGA